MQLDWPQGATSRESMRAVWKLLRLPVIIPPLIFPFHQFGFVIQGVILWFSLMKCCMQNLIMQHVDHSAGDLIDLLQGLLRYDPAERLMAREALRHPFFTRDLRRCGYPL